jgi:triacylglycerol lipase
MNIVLCHGILGFRTFLGVNYFNGVKAHIEAKYPAVKILVTQVDPVAAVNERGAQLRGQILEALGDTGMPPTLAPGDKTHIVAHSMGGLDARYVLSPANQGNIGGRVTSLTTISTPHRGSPVADLLMAEAQGALGLSDRVTAASMRHSMTLLGIPLAGLHDLTTAATAAFNAQNTDNPGVQYFAAAGEGRGGVLPTSALLLAPYLYVKDKTSGQANDGLVAVGSAAWGQGPTELLAADHVDEIGHNLDELPVGTPRHFDYLAKYDGIVERLLRL